jgi:hypothetical protein
MAEFLVAGQIGDPTIGLPGGKGAALYLLSEDSYGQQVASTGGDDSLAKIQTGDAAIVGRGGRGILRRIYVEVVWDDGNPVLRITPVVNFNELLEPQNFELPNTAVQKRRTLVYKSARPCSFVGVIVEVLSRQGLTEIGPVHAAVKPLTAASEFITATADD